MEYRQLITENQRLAVLKFLKDDGDYTLNTSILQDGLTAIGQDISRDKLETEVNWLAEQGLVEIEHYCSVTVCYSGQADGARIRRGRRSRRRSGRKTSASRLKGGLNAP